MLDLSLLRSRTAGVFSPPPPPDPEAPDFTLSNATVATTWGTVVVGNLVPTNAPVGAYFVLVTEDAGLAVVGA